MHLAVAGNKGSFSHAAGQLYCTAQAAGDCNFIFTTDSEGVFKALAEKQAGYGIMPIYNPTGGLVEMTLEAMGKHNFTVAASFSMPVQQCLLTLPMVRPDTIMKIFSHQQAIKQCQHYLDTNWPECQLENYSDTAQAAADLAAGILPSDSAVLAPKLCAQIYGLRVIAESVQDDKENQTVFIVVKNIDQASAV